MEEKIEIHYDGHGNSIVILDDKPGRPKTDEEKKRDKELWDRFKRMLPNKPTRNIEAALVKEELELQSI